VYAVLLYINYTNDFNISREEARMAEILAITTHATDDQTKGSFAFITAVGAVGAGKEVSIALLGEAVYLAKEEVANSVHGVGFPPLSELIDKVVKANVPVYL
jgi:predicted peroxiredoxin